MIALVICGILALGTLGISVFLKSPLYQFVVLIAWLGFSYLYGDSGLGGSYWVLTACSLIAGFQIWRIAKGV